jgi:hypothetical protein
MELTEKAKEGKQRVTLQRQALMNEPENRQIQADIQELAKEIKEVKEQLGDELVAYFMKNQTLEYVDSTGTKRKFRVSARFVGKNSEEA